MHYSTLTLLLAFSATALALPLSKRALTSQPYTTFSVSSGTSGSALAEVDANFPVPADLSTTSAADLKIISAAAKLSEDAEVETGGFNDAIAAAGGVKSVEGVKLQNGKIKNKVLKLETDVLRLMIQVCYV